MKTFEVTYTYGKLNIEIEVKVETKNENSARRYVTKFLQAKKIISVKEIK